MLTEGLWGCACAKILYHDDMGLVFATCSLMMAEKMKKYKISSSILPLAYDNFNFY